MSQLLRYTAGLRSTSVACRSFHTSITRFQKKESEVIKQQEEHGELPKEVVSGAPQALVTERVVRIYKESKPSTQSGTWGMLDNLYFQLEIELTKMF